MTISILAYTPFVKKREYIFYLKVRIIIRVPFY